MRILALSDLHLDHFPGYTLPSTFPHHDVAVVAGDVAGPTPAGVRYLSRLPQLAGSAILMVAGNHEFYGQEVEASLRQAQEAAAGTNVTLLDRGVATVGGRTFVGTTLWTDYKLFGDVGKAMLIADAQMNDHKMIKVAREGGVHRFTPADAARRHAAERSWLDKALHLAGPGAVVVTHHAPHHGSVARRYMDDPLTAAFVNDMSRMLKRRRPALWLHGHVHDSFDYRVGDTRIVCNPKGYSQRMAGRTVHENARFDEYLVIDLA